MDDPKVMPSVISDTPDNYVLAAAKVAEATRIVTGDKLLLAVQQFEGITIITPKEFLHTWGR